MQSIVASTDPLPYVASLILKKDDAVLDIGANHGQMAMKFAQYCRHVYSFEPNPEQAALARKSMPDNVTLVEKAVSDSNQFVSFYIDRRPGMNAVASSILKLDEMPDEFSEKIEVEAITIDDFVAAKKINPKLIKIDVEGHERAVIEGGINTIRSHRPYVIFELWESYWPEFDACLSQISDIYRFHRLSDGLDAYHAYSERLGDDVDNIICVPL